MLVDVGVATLMCVSAKSVNLCLCIIIVQVRSYTSRFVAK